ncbi:UDP-N-acetylmuramate dehydrogenase [Sulfoacidibacillus thermotolerans]|uniref:UDP-N-acetylenolpyruvoylglucosamine reductase n=1 Tax=Sulfoacidibacillus thermotolerans TaxID=1765684 RepID=A0A2U3D8U7_SULT2|nr:UDP-N-acetylmuramate dehydrogenase [Sulfoacidibacillus thermotolerans]PWI57702.1 UDP-N-acetylenolpyruvoylglucosamine reductase [Sulfoacidibacillus thermotolerans]
MDRVLLETIFTGLAPTILYDEPLAKHTTWRIGGPADVLLIPRTIDEVRAVVLAAKAHDLPLFVLGRGSNLLVKDGGMRGAVLKLGDEFAAIAVSDRTLSALAGRSIVSAAHIAIRHGLSGLEFATGIPGTVGGAVTMNAGAHGGEIKDVLKQATVITSDGTITELSADDLGFRYRHSIVPEQRLTVVQAEFALQPGDTKQLQEKVRAWSKRRQLTQPLSLPSCGSVFRNPPGHYAARLIEEAGLKGLRHGNAMISEVHANFIVNVGQASAADVLWLIRHAQETVQQRFGMTLEPEVRIVGEDETRR